MLAKVNKLLVKIKSNYLLKIYFKELLKNFWQSHKSIILNIQGIIFILTQIQLSDLRLIIVYS